MANVPATDPATRNSLLTQSGFHESTARTRSVPPSVAVPVTEKCPISVGATPLISTSKGVEGLNLQPNVHYLRADDAESLAERTAALLSDPILRNCLSAAGRAHVGATADWEPIGARFVDAVTAIARTRIAV